MKNAWGKLIVMGAFAAFLPGFTGSVQAFEVPRYVYDFERLAEAQAEGFEDKKPMLFLLADPAKEPT